MYGNFDERGLRIPQYYGGAGNNQRQNSNFNQGVGTTRSEQMMQGNMGNLSSMMQADQNYGGQRMYGGYGQNYAGPQSGMSQTGGNYGSNYGANYGAGSGMGNQYGSYNQNATRDIGTTPSEQSMQQMQGGLSQAMQADRNYGGQRMHGGYGQNYAGPQSGMSQTGGNYGSNYGANYGAGSGMGNQYGSYNQNATRDIGTTPSEQSMQQMQGGLSQAMQADQNYGGQRMHGGYGQNYGGSPQYGQSYASPGQSGQNYAGSQSGMSQSGGNYGSTYGTNYGAGSGMGNQYGSYNQNATRDIGTTPSEQSMQQMQGGMSQVMQADHTYGAQSMSGGYGQNYGGGYGQSQSTFAPGSNYHGGAGTGYGYGSQYSNQPLGQGYTANQQSGSNNPGDTPLEQAAKRNINPSSGGFPSDEF